MASIAALFVGGPIGERVIAIPIDRRGNPPPREYQLAMPEAVEMHTYVLEMAGSDVPYVAEDGTYRYIHKA